MGATTIFPVTYAGFLSLFDWNWGSRFNFVGLDNYASLMTDRVYWASVGRTITFAVSAVAIELVLGLGLAVVVNRLSGGVGWVRTILMLPMMVSGIVVSLVWKIMLDPTLGVIPHLLGRLGLGTLDLLGNPHVALISVAGIDSWWQTGFVFIVLSASLGALPEECFEAARVDGATSRQTFWHITMPLLRPALLTVAAIRMVDCLKVFALIYGTTEGGPQNATEVTQILVYRRAFKEFAMSESMTMMLVYSALVVAVLATAYLVHRKWGGREA
jgi:multiple sugar transport system permease protein